MLVVGLTGGIGCGKSIVSDLFHQNFNTPIIDADIIARELPDKSFVRDLLLEALGAEYFDENKILIREKLRQAVFSDSELRTKLESILHPLVYDELNREIKKINAKYCIAVIPLLLETNRSDFVDRILVVDCTVEEQIRRVMLRDQCDENHVRNIISSQVDRDTRLELADDVINNHGDIESLNEKVTILHEKYISLSKEKNNCEQ